MKSILIAIAVSLTLGFGGGFYLCDRLMGPDKKDASAEKIALEDALKDPLLTKEQEQEIVEKIKIAQKLMEIKTGVDFDFTLTLNLNMLYDDDLFFTPAIGGAFWKFYKNDKVLLMFPEIQVGSKLDDISVLISPFVWNIGYHIPIIDNTYLKPYFGFHNTDLTFGVGIGLNF